MTVWELESLIEVVAFRQKIRLLTAIKVGGGEYQNSKLATEWARVAVQGSQEHFGFTLPGQRAPGSEAQNYSKSPSARVFYVAALVMFVTEKREIGTYRITTPRRAENDDE